jgi:hypothetical protein
VMQPGVYRRAVWGGHAPEDTPGPVNFQVGKHLPRGCDALDSANILTCRR